MNVQQTLYLAMELKKICDDLLEVSTTTLDHRASIEVGEANVKLCEIGKTLCDHAIEMAKES